MAKWEISDEEFEKEFKEANEKASLNFDLEPKIYNVKYDSKKDFIFITLTNNVYFGVPIKSIPELSNKDKKQLSNITLTPLKETLVWEELDVHLGLKGLIVDSFKLLNWMSSIIAQKNGKIKSEAKAESSKINGLKGGRPPVIRLVTKPIHANEIQKERLEKRYKQRVEKKQRQIDQRNFSNNSLTDIKSQNLNN